MTIAPFVENSEDNREIFTNLRKLSVDINAKNMRYGPEAAPRDALWRIGEKRTGSQDSPVSLTPGNIQI